MGNHTQLSVGDTASVQSGHKIRITAKSTNRGKFNMGFSYAQDLIAQKAPNATSTLFRLIARVERENQVYFSLSQHAKEFGVPRTTLEGHLARLREVGVVVPDPKQEERKRGIVLWRICPFLVWTESREAMEKYLKGLPKDHPFFRFADPEFVE
jgi:hypothetical protein